MKILVPVKRTLDAYIKVRVCSDNSGVDLGNARMAMNPFCEIALEEAIRLKEAGQATEVIAVSIGGEKVQEQLRTAMALGADRSIHVLAADGLESLNVAKLLCAVAEREQPGLILLGKQAIDSDNNQVGQMLAALLKRPQATFASKVEIAGSRVLVTREVDGGEQVLSVAMPAVITADLRLNEPRYAKLPDIMKAKKKPVETLDPAVLGVSLKSHLEITAVREPAPRKPGIMVQSVAELVERLRKEAGVLP